MFDYIILILNVIGVIFTLLIAIQLVIRSRVAKMYNFISVNRLKMWEICFREFNLGIDQEWRLKAYKEYETKLLRTQLWKRSSTWNKPYPKFLLPTEEIKYKSNRILTEREFKKMGGH